MESNCRHRLPYPEEGRVCGLPPTCNRPPAACIRRIHWLMLALSTIILAACTSLQSLHSTANTAESAIHVEPEGTGTSARVEMTARSAVAPGQATIDIESPGGIGAVHGTITGARPDTLIFRIHVAALEGVTFEYDRQRVTGSADPVIQSVWVQVEDGRPVELEAGDPDWLAVAAYHADGSPARESPVPDGYFEIAAPPAFLSGESTEFRLEWVDFYR